MLCIPYQHPSLEPFYVFKLKLHTLAPFPSLSPSSFWQPLICFQYVWLWLSQTHHALELCNPFSLAPSSTLRSFWSICQSFLPFRAGHITECREHILSTQSPVNRHLGWVASPLGPLGIVVWWTWVYTWWFEGLHLIIGGKLLDSMAILFITSWGCTTVFSTETTPFYNLTRKSPELQFLYIFVNTPFSFALTITTVMHMGLQFYPLKVILKHTCVYR